MNNHYSWDEIPVISSDSQSNLQYLYQQLNINSDNYTKPAITEKKLNPLVTYFRILYIALALSRGMSQVTFIILPSLMNL